MRQRITAAFSVFPHNLDEGEKELEKHINLPETAIILAANLKGYDEDNSGWDILLEARRKYFATRKRYVTKCFHAGNRECSLPISDFAQ